MLIIYYGGGPDDFGLVTILPSLSPHPSLAVNFCTLLATTDLHSL